MRLQQVGDGPFHAADDAAVHHDRAVPGAVGADVAQAEALRLVEVDLHGGQGGLAARGAGDLHVDLRSVEGRLALGRLVGDAGGVQHLAQQGGGPFPQGRVGDVLAGPARQRQAVPGRADAQVGVGAGDEREGGAGLGDGLVRGAEDVRVVELDGPYPGQPAQHPGRLGAVHAAQFGDPQRQLPVTAGPGAVDEGVVRTEAGPQHHLFRPQLHGREHVVAVVVPVAGDLVQLAFAEHGRVHVPVPGRALRLADVLLQGVPDDGAVGQPVGQTRAHQRVGVEQAELTAEASMVVHGGLLAVGRRAPRATKPRGTRPGASSVVSCQRAGTLSGVVVRDTWARCMRRTVAGAGGHPRAGFRAGGLTRTARRAGGGGGPVVP